MRGMWKQALPFGVLGGVLIAALQFFEYRWLVQQHAVQLYAALVAAIFAAVGIWLGAGLTRRTETVIVREVQVPVEVPVRATMPFERDQEKVAALGLTPRELEILALIAEGLSNKEIAERAFVSENTVKTHSSRVFDKLGVRRRTQAVQVGKTMRLIP